MSQMLTTDLILTEKNGIKALHPSIAPLGLGRVFLNESTAPEHPFPSLCSPVSHSGPGHALSYMGLALPPTPTCAHPAGISTGCNDPSLCLRTK